MASKNDIPTWGLIVMFCSSLVGMYFMSKDLLGRFQ